MGGLDHGVAFGGEHPDAAQGTAVVVKGDDGLSKTLVADLLFQKASCQGNWIGFCGPWRF